jgi:chromate reductase, NAD(P)H dehydrogenase (quinone)
VHELFEDNGNIKEGETKEFIKKAVDAFISWFKRNTN